MCCWGVEPKGRVQTLPNDAKCTQLVFQSRVEKHLPSGKLQAIDKVAPFFQKSLDLVASKLSLEVVPFWKTQANSGGHSATMFLGVFLFFLAFSLGLGI